MPQEERVIQFFGILRPNAEEGRIIKWWRIYYDLLRPQISRYRNDRYPLYQTFYGYVQSLYEERVLQTYSLQYNNQWLDYQVNTAAFVHAAVSCALEANNTSFENQNNGLGFTNISRNNPVKSWNILFPFPEELRIRLLTPNVKIRILMEWEYLDTCVADRSPEPSPQPISKSEVPSFEFPADTNDNVIQSNSPAYSPPDDNGLTYLPGDPPPPGNFEDCERVRVNTRVVSSLGVESFVDYEVYAPVQSVSVTCNSDGQTFTSNLIITCRGLISRGTCRDEIIDEIVGGSSGAGGSNNCFQQFSIVSIEAI